MLKIIFMSIFIFLLWIYTQLNATNKNIENNKNISNKIIVNYDKKDYNIYILKTWWDKKHFYLNKYINQNIKLEKEVKDLSKEILTILEKYQILSNFKSIRIVKDLNSSISIYNKANNAKTNKDFFSVERKIYYNNKLLLNNRLIKDNLIIFYKIISKNKISSIWVQNFKSYWTNSDIKKRKALDEINRVLEKYSLKKDPNIVNMWFYWKEYKIKWNNLYIPKKEIKLKVESKPIIKTKPIIPKKKKGIMDIYKDFWFTFQKIIITSKIQKKCGISNIKKIKTENNKQQLILSSMLKLPIKDFSEKRLEIEKQKLLDSYKCAILEYNKIHKTKKTLKDIDVVLVYKNNYKDDIYLNNIKSNTSFIDIKKLVSKNWKIISSYFINWLDQIYKDYENIAKNISFDEIKKIYPNITLKEILLNPNKYDKLNKDILNKIELVKREKLNKYNNLEFKYFYNYNSFFNLDNKNIFINNNDYKYYFYSNYENYLNITDVVNLIKKIIFTIFIIVNIIFIFYLYNIKLTKKERV